jgi:hypothetical protein
MNVPGCAEGNWRCTQQMLSASVFEWLRALTISSNRSAELRSTETVGRVGAASAS